MTAPLPGNMRMNAQECLSALEDTLNEIKKVCPEISSTFIFRKDKKILAKDEKTDQATIHRTMEAFSALNEKAAASGGLESATFYGTNSQATIVRVNNLCFATVATREAGEKTLNALTHVLVPTMLRLVETIQPELTGSAFALPTGNESADRKVKDAEKREDSSENKSETDAASESPFPNPVASQLMVANLSGIGSMLGPQDIVRIDNRIISQWKREYCGRKIEEVEVEETCTGKKLRCKFKPTKDSSFDGKGIIQMPQKTQLTLQTNKGALVLVKPIIE
jgi:hypothetical protein